MGPFARRIYRIWVSLRRPFPGSNNYWIDRYESGGNSGDGSYNELAEFKAEVINDFVSQNEIATVIEYGCGDGNQLRLAKYPLYVGFDISSKAVSLCEQVFHNDDKKVFKQMEDFRGETAELTLSLDVIYHLVEDTVFTNYMNRLFESSKGFVIIYSSNTEENQSGQAAHVRHRNFTVWIEKNKPEWKLLLYIPNRYPFNVDTKTGSFADFYIYGKQVHTDRPGERCES